MMTKRERFYPEDIARIGEHSIQMVKSGVIRNHKLGNSAREHSGETEEKESSLFIDFLSTRNCDLMINLRGNNNV